MEKKIGVCTDSGCDLSDEILERYHIRFIPLRIIYRDREFLDRVNVSTDYIYQRMDTELPTSSMPSIEDIKKTWDLYAEEGYTHLIQITISSGLSGTYNTMQLCAKEYTRMQVVVYDALTLSMAEGLQVLFAARGVEQGMEIDDILAKMRAIRMRIMTGYVVKTLEYLMKGGRIGKVEGLVGSLLRICPIISVNEEGIYYPMAKALGYRRGLEALKREFSHRFKNKEVTLAVMHGGALEEATNMAKELCSIARVREYFFGAISPVLGVHTGPGLVGVIAYE